MTNIDIRPTVDAPDDDPHIWLEDIEGEAAIAWVERQNRDTMHHFANGAFEADRDALASIYNRADKIPYVTRRGAYLYNFWIDARNPRGLWRRATMEEFRKDFSTWEILLDLDALASTEGEDWVWGGSISLPKTHNRAILRLSRGGGDASVLREFDLERKSFVADGFNVPEAKGGVSWLDADTVLLMSAYGDNMATRSGYARTIRLWTRGGDPLTAPVIFETTYENNAVYAYCDRTSEAETVWFTDSRGFYDADRWIGDRNGARVKLDVPKDASVSCSHDWLILEMRKGWEIGGAVYAPGTLVAIKLSVFLTGDRKFDVLFENAGRRALESVSFCGGRLILGILDNLSPQFEALTPSPHGWTRERLAGAPEIGAAYVWRLDWDESEANGELLAQTENPLTPATLKLLSPDSAPQVLKRAPEVFNAQGLRVTRHDAVSIDGERIPYTQVGPGGETGEAPVHLYGYGGFAVSKKPSYNASIGKMWLERGGVSVVANLRGGGEFGVRWHEVARREGKALSHDDFAAVAADLVRRGVTRPGRIAAEGGSNGGLLIANMLTRYPERFGALFCTIPLIDMRRYSKLLAGSSWINEYGDPDKPEDWAFIKTLSAYHVAALVQPYPPILLATTRKDDRVHPGHARKMAAKLQAMGYAAHFYEPAAGGHGYGKNNAERAAFAALGYNFLRRSTGWDADAA
ncbi:MAG: prolyl oligopeptidase family serine peptidase [Hyphomicrobiales bacterium]|nr:prolyl oligopeptidase family serine peptidase [Hyphomicrobiales bacterium]